MGRKRTFIVLGLAVVMALSVGVLSGCSSGGGASASSTTTSASASVSSSSASSEASTASSQADSSSQEGFNSALVGTWHIYSVKSSKVNGLQINSKTMALLRRLGLHDTLTFYHDGTFDIDSGGGKVETHTWEETAHNQFVLNGMYGEKDDTPVDAKVESGRLIFDADSKDNDYGIMTLTYSK